MPIGPALPPHLAHLSASSSTEAGPSTRSTTPPQDPPSESDDDDYGPALPPHLAAARTAGPSRPTQPTSITPSVPSTRYQQEEDEESDDDIGPKPPGAEEAGPEKSGVEEFLEREKRRAERIEEESKPKALKRDEWMLVPPEAGIMSSCMSPWSLSPFHQIVANELVDPLRKRPTTFNRSSKEVVVDNTMWTETPAQKQQRMADEAAGVKRQKDPVRGEKDQSFESKGKRQRDEELKAQVERHSVGPIHLHSILTLL